jgi:hypothetical protein
LIVVLILGITAALVSPMIGNAASSQLRAAAGLVAADLDAARMTSLSHAEDPCVFVVDTTAASYHLAFASSPTVAMTNPVGNLPYSVTFGQGRADALPAVEIQSVAFGGDSQLGFGVFGQLDQAADATLTLEANGSTLTLTISASTGDVTIGDIQ